MEQNTSNNYLVPLAIMVAGVFVAAAIYFGTDSENSAVATKINNNQNNTITVPPVTEKDRIIGSRNAPIVIVEYSDIECPFCKVFHQTMKQIVSDYNGQVSWVYRHFPIAQLHSKAVPEAEATECAYELGGNQTFWNYLDKLFETTNSNNSLDLSLMPALAAEVGLNEASFRQCLESGRHNAFVTASVEEAVKAGARGTPYSVIITQNGQKVVINGAEPVTMVKTKIDALLEQ